MIINENDVLKYLNKMKENKSPGPDRIYPKILKNVKNQIANPLTQIFNKSLQEKKVPTDWKLADVTPIFKKGDRKLPGNYRPISLTSVVCKLLESIIRDKIVKHLEHHNLIRDSQHGFRNKRSCLTNLLEFYNKLFHIHDQTKTLDIIYLDFQKAFDKVPHNKLLTKVKALGIIGNIYGWIENWLQGRKQRVVVNGETSSWVPVGSGVPQGSVLGPILFLIYINDIDIGISSPISKFADDTKIGRPVIDNKDRLNLQKDLDTISNWSEKWQMPFNINKCQLLLVGSANKKYKYKMMGNNIESVSQVRDLGVTITSNLKFSQQCNEVSLRANRMLGFIKRNFVFKSKDIIIPLYQSLVRPHLEYAVQFWSPHLQKDILKLETVQRRATKLIPSLRQKSYEERLRELNLFSLMKRRIRGQLIECFKFLKGYNNVDASNLLTLAPDLPTRGNSLKLKGKRVNLDSTKYFFTNAIVDKWNSLPENVIQSTSITSFKNNLDIYLSQNPLE
ncbi:MAG: reverse transcriptase family protein [Gammaproteobacteria bacterium]|nr:reverse transcriptase family protein [Gammaproteobacteria bacterium]